MKIKNIACAAGLLLASLTAAQAQTTLAAWNFENAATGLNASPVSSAGLGSASALGLGNTFNSTNSISNPDVFLSPAGSSAGGAGKSWRVRGASTVAGNGGNGWSTSAAIGTQGVQFSGSTFGYYKINVSFDVYLDTPSAEANLQVQYTTDGSTWKNAVVTSSGTAGDVISINSSSPNTVTGSYIKLVNGWNNSIVVSLNGLSGVDNDANFAIRLVNASTGTDCLDTTGAVYGNLTGSWTFDNVAIQGTSIDTIVDWTFESYPSAATVITNPVAEIGGTNAGQAHSIGFNNNYAYAGGNGTGSIDASDINNTGGSSSGTAGPNAWRVRGAIPASGVAGIGWNTAAPIGSQGAQFDVPTVGYSNIVVTFDIYFTSAAEAKMCMVYTTDGWVTTNVANNLFYGAAPAYIFTNTSSPNTVTGTYFYETGGQGFYNNFVADFTGIPGVENNPLFGFKLVNAAKGTDCLNSSGTAYNNSSGNTRFDNITVGGTAGTPPPALALDPNATVDAPFTNTFTDSPAWRANIALVFVNGVVLTNSAYNTNFAGKIIFTPSKSALLQSAGVKNISFVVPGFGTAKLTQPVAPGVATQLALSTKPTGPSASGGTLVANPVIAITDQYGNGTTNPYAAVTVTATAGGGTWTLGGDTTQSFINGFATFTNLSATANTTAGSVSNYITFTLSGYAPLTVTNSALFNIGAAPVPFTPGNLAVLQLDKSANNTTLSIIEVKPAAAGQTNAVNVVPVSATSSNALRMASSATCGRLALSDDGTLICFGAFLDNSAATPDETLNLNRAAVGMDASNNLTIGFNYTSTSLGGSQARSCTILADKSNWIVDDKGGLYEGSSGALITQPNLNPYNNVVVKSFGATPYILTQKVTGPSVPGFYYLGFDSDTGLYDVTPFVAGVPVDANAVDFYMISTNGGTTFDILYILDSVSTNGIVNKYSLVNGSWSANGSYTNRLGGAGGDSLFATTNGAGGVYLYVTTAPSANNSIVRLTDSAAWNQTISITSSNVLYTAPGNTYVKGLTFVPQVATNAVQLTPPPVLVVAAPAQVGTVFAVTNSPDVSAWRSAITSITVNGTLLPPAAYSTTQTGKIVFDPSQSALLQGVGPKAIAIAATGFSTNTVVQNISAGPAAQLVILTQPAAPSADGAVLATQPVVVVEDSLGNIVSASTASVTAAPAQSGWNLGGTASKAAVSGTVTFTGLTAFSTNALSGATIAFTSSGLTSATSSPSFN
ncbi:MAG TPA: hemoblobin-interacting domain-containing protein, partial [Verrucomicrobiae bacterium]|nr:hemoblobin-interacting domain-containing protein [Verrucomicrobiae bacterium]